jgi:hypothetical protein
MIVAQGGALLEIRRSTKYKFASVKFHLFYKTEIDVPKSCRKKNHIRRVVDRA